MVRSPYYCDKSGLKKGTWTPEEDWKLIAYVTTHGHKNWRQLPKFAAISCVCRVNPNGTNIIVQYKFSGLSRCGKSCRLRWMNYLRPGIKRGNYTHEEDETIIKLQASLGNRWSVIASHLPGRSDNEIKNHWHAHLKNRFQHHSVTNEKAEASNSKHHSPLESNDEKDYVEVDSSHFQNSSLATSLILDASPSSQHTSLSDFFCMITEPAPASDGDLVIDDLLISWRKTQIL